MLPKQKIMTDAQQGGGEEEEDDGSAVVVRRLPRPASACRNNVGVCPKKYNYQVLLHHARMKAKASAFEKTLPSCLVWQESGTKYVSFFFFLVSSNGLLKGGKGGGCSWGARTGHERKFVEEKISLYRGEETNLSRLQLDDTPGKRRGHGGRGLKERPQFLDECGRLERRNKLRSGVRTITSGTGRGGEEERGRLEWPYSSPYKTLSILFTHCSPLNN